MNTKHIIKQAFSLNLAAIVRAARFGAKDASARMTKAFYVIDPFPDEQPQEIDYLSRIPEIPLNECVKSQPIIAVDGLYSYIDGSLPWCDIVALLSVIVDRRPNCVLEIGTFNGHTTRLLALNLPDSSIHTVDLPENYDAIGSNGSPFPKDDFHLIQARKVGKAYRSDPSIKNITQHYGDSADWDFSSADGATFYFIDGSHTYEYARNDTEKAIAAVQGRPATLVWHDCNDTHPGVTRWLAEMISNGLPVKHICGTNVAILDIGC